MIVLISDQSFLLCTGPLLTIEYNPIVPWWLLLPSLRRVWTIIFIVFVMNIFHFISLKCTTVIQYIYYTNIFQVYVNIWCSNVKYRLESVWIRHWCRLYLLAMWEMLSKRNKFYVSETYKTLNKLSENYSLFDNYIYIIWG